MKELATVDRYEQMNSCVQLFLKGENPTGIAKVTGLRRVDVLGYLDEWKALASNSEGLQAMAREAVLGSAQHYDMLIKELWGIVNDPGVDLRTKSSTLKIIAELEEKRINFLQKAGLLDDAALGDEIAMMEDRSAAIKQLLVEVTSKYPETKMMIMKGLSEVFGQAVAIDA